MNTKSRMGGDRVYKLKEILRDNDISYEEIGEVLNIKSSSTISLKINNKSVFSTKEAALLRDLIEKKSGKKYSLEELFLND